MRIGMYEYLVIEHKGKHDCLSHGDIIFSNPVHKGEIISFALGKADYTVDEVIHYADDISIMYVKGVSASFI